MDDYGSSSEEYDSDEFEDILELVETGPFSFEETLAWEKEMIWFSVSGHALDGLGRYCMRRSNNVKKLKISMQDLLEMDKKAKMLKVDLPDGILNLND